MIEDGTRLRVYVDANTLLSGAVAVQGGNGYGSPSLVCIVLSEMGLINLRCTDFGVREARGNLRRVVDEGEDEAVEELNSLIEKAIEVHETPPSEVWERYSGCADEKDLVHYASAVENDCRVIATINTSDFYPPPESPVKVMPPADLVVRARLMINEIDTMAQRGIWFEV